MASSSAAYADHAPVPRTVPSDDRAEFFDGNITSCTDAPLDLETPPTIPVGANRDNPASDANVSGTVETNAGDISPGQGEELNVTITGGANVVIDAVVIKAGEGFNVYRDPATLPPAAPAPQHYIGPLVGESNVPDISHWFICYHLEEEPPPTGSLSVIKTLLQPAGVPAEPLPTEFTVDVTCTLPDDTEETATVTFGSGGGVGEPTPALDGLPEDTVCTVVEQGTDDFPDGAVVTYNPPEANTTGVTISADEPVVVEVVNDFTNVDALTGFLQILKVVEPGGVPLPDTLTVHVACATPDAEEDDVIVDVSVPGIGGEGTPVLELPAGTFCTIAEETDTLPPGTAVTYQVDDGEPTTETPVDSGRIVGDTTITVTITNTPPQPMPPPPGPPEPPDVLPDTGSGSLAGLLVAAGALTGGGALAWIGAVSWRRTNRDSVE